MSRMSYGQFRKFVRELATQEPAILADWFDDRLVIDQAWKGHLLALLRASSVDVTYTPLGGRHLAVGPTFFGKNRLALGTPADIIVRQVPFTELTCFGLTVQYPVGCGIEVRPSRSNSASDGHLSMSSADSCLVPLGRWTFGEVDFPTLFNPALFAVAWLCCDWGKHAVVQNLYEACDARI